jgi:hypothetical protein
MRWLLVLAVALLPPTAAAQAMYKCVDARGVTHYTDKPLPGCKTRESEPKGQPPAPGKVAAQKEAPKREERAVQRPKTAAEKAKEAELLALEQHKRRCALLEGELRRIEKYWRLRSAGAGESTVGEDAARESRATVLRGQIGRECR